MVDGTSCSVDQSVTTPTTNADQKSKQMLESGDVRKTIVKSLVQQREQKLPQRCSTLSHGIRIYGLAYFKSKKNLKL